MGESGSVGRDRGKVGLTLAAAVVKLSLFATATDSRIWRSVVFTNLIE